MCSFPMLLIALTFTLFEQTQIIDRFQAQQIASLVKLSMAPASEAFFFLFHLLGSKLLKSELSLDA